MSEETPDVGEMTRRGLERSNRREYDAAVSIFSSHAVWDMSTTGVGVFEGRDAIKAFFEEWAASFDDFVAGLEEFQDLGNGVTLTVISQRGKPPGGTGLVQQPYGAVSTWDEGRITRVTLYLDVDEARAAAEQLARERE